MDKEKYPLIERMYRKFVRLVSRPQERGIQSAGYWMGKVRQNSVAMCANDTGNLLEVGCGEGLFLTELASVNKQVHLTGIDNLPDRLSGAEKRLKQYSLKGVQLFQADATHMPFQSEQFETIVCINLFFNLPSLEVIRMFLQEMKRVCRPQGRIIFDIKNSRNPLLYWKYRFAPWYDSTVINHPLKTYKLEDMVQVLEETGLRIIGKTAIGFPWLCLAPVILIEAEKK